MVEPLLFVPGYGFSPRCAEEVPSYAASLKELREHFDVTIFHWPCVKGGPDFPLTWQGTAAAIAEMLPMGGHVLADGGNATWALLALEQTPSRLRSMVALGFELTIATLEAAGMQSLARAQEAAAVIDPDAQQGALPWFEGADPEEARRMFERIFRDAPRKKDAEALSRQAQEMNLFAELAPVHIPALLVESPIPLPGYAEIHDLFSRFVPGAEVAWLDRYAGQDPESGLALAGLAIPFMQKHSGRTILSTVLFADIVDSTVQAATMGDRHWSQLLGQFHSLAGGELKKSGGRLVDTAGDGFLAVFDDPGAAIRFATNMGDTVRELGLETRAGVHTGQVEVSGDKYSGVAVHTAARVAAKAAPGEVLVSDTVRQLLAGSALTFEERGVHDLKGLPEPVRLYATLSDSA